MRESPRIKVFLGGYVNSQNAQNNNCRSLSEHLDQEKFEIWTMITWHGYPKKNDFVRVPGVHYLYDTPAPWTEKMHLPFWLFSWLSYAIGIIKCDVAYLPKGEYVGFCHWIAKLCRCKLFTTLEGILPEEFFTVRKDLNREKYIQNIRRFKNLYSITKCIAQKESEEKGLRFKEKVLYLGVESNKFHSERVACTALTNLVFIGFDTVRKHASEFIRMAELFPSLKFYIIGGNMLEGGQAINEYLSNNKVENCIHLGALDHKGLSHVLKTIDLMFFPSRSEGFPKVMLEAACAGVPTLCYNDYGADEWITNGVDGFVVNTFDEAKGVIQDLIDNPEKLQPLSDAAVELGKRFDWNVLVKAWEIEIERIASEA